MRAGGSVDMMTSTKENEVSIVDASLKSTVHTFL